MNKPQIPNNSKIIETVYSTSGRIFITHYQRIVRGGARDWWINPDFCAGAGLFIFDQILARCVGLSRAEAAQRILDQIEEYQAPGELPDGEKKQVVKVVIFHNVLVCRSLENGELTSFSVSLGRFAKGSFGSVSDCEFVVRWK